MALCWRSLTSSWRRRAGSWRTRGDSAGFLSRSMASACSWTRARSSMARWRRCHSVRQSRENAAPSAHMTHVVARHTGPMICITRKPVDVADVPPAKPTTVRTTPTTRNAMDIMNMHRPADSNVDQRFDICDSIDAPTRPSLSTVEMDDRDASVSWAAVDDDGRSVLLSASTTSIGNVSFRSVVAVALTGDDWITLPEDGDVRYKIPAATYVNQYITTVQ